MLLSAVVKIFTLYRFRILLVNILRLRTLRLLVWQMKDLEKYQQPLLNLSLIRNAQKRKFRNSARNFQDIKDLEKLFSQMFHEMLQERLKNQNFVRFITARILLMHKIVDRNRDLFIRIVCDFESRTIFIL